MRLFIGIDIPSDIKNSLIDLQDRLKAKGIKGSWKRVENMHITLEFLGELEAESVAVLSEILSNAAKDQRLFVLEIAGLGAFPSFKRPHTVWAGIEGNIKELKQLRDKLHNDLLAAGFKLDDRPFKPHLTIVSRPSITGNAYSEHINDRIGDFRINKIVLFESKVVEGKRVYTNLNEAKLL